MEGRKSAHTEGKSRAYNAEDSDSAEGPEESFVIVDGRMENPNFNADEEDIPGGGGREAREERIGRS